MNILISDKIHDTAIQLLKDNGISVTYNPEISAEELPRIIEGFDGLVVRSRTKVTSDVLSNGKQLQFVSRVGSGVDNIDTSYCSAHNIMVLNAPDANSEAVAEHTVGLMLSLLRNYPKAFASTQGGLWLKKELTGSELMGKTVGIVGYGRIGKRVAELLKAFGAHVEFYSKSSKTITLEELFRTSDIISLHISLTPETKGIINKKLLSLMKPSAYILNLSRGEIVEEKALFSILYEEKIKGAALDVYWQEPLPVDSRWITLKNVILTPHIGASTKEAFLRASSTVAEDIVRMEKGEKPIYQKTDNK